MERANKKNKRKKSGLWFPRLKGKNILPYPGYLSKMSGPPRFFEIDLFRGIAIGIMVLFHTLFDLIRIGICPVTVTSGFWKYFARILKNSPCSR
ncbi:MAG: hypothetical protein METHP_01587 [Methanoregula sp. SKADARSKE-2]|nr:MAG: hypothetical protein METHP_01587 [Methanoregula sp. SKADARSKE-2]